jgi:hypothetical protein
MFPMMGLFLVWIPVAGLSDRRFLGTRSGFGTGRF